MATVAKLSDHQDDNLRARLEAIQRPPLEAATLPPEAYWSEELYQRELDAIFFKEWLCVGRADQIPNKGDFFVHEVDTESLIIVRDHDDQIRAHLNVCRHRGCQVAEGSGNTPAFKCPYHGWMYGLNGDLRGAPEFRHTENFNKADYPLASVQTEIWEGFIMINFDLEAEPFAPRVSESSKFGFDKYGVGDMVTTHTWHHVLDCNWKEWIENSMEEYHIPWVHTETFQAVSPMKGWVEFPDITEQPWILMVGQFPGFSMSNTGDALFPVNPALADLKPEYSGVPIWVMYPSFGIFQTVDSCLYYVLLPEGPNKSHLRLGLCLPRESAEAFKRGDDPKVMEAAAEYAANVEAFLVEDNAICEKQHRGNRSRHAKPGRFSHHELVIQMFDRWVAEKAYL